jgi:tRNA A37 threonylcarbamoyladenosine synthetase subunit TsaC/SUA5/YrdC
MPLHPVALEVLKGVGPMVVVAANRVGEPVPRTCDDAEAQLDTNVIVYLDAGTCPDGAASTVVDLTEREPRVLRAGAFSEQELRTVAADLIGIDEHE